MAVSKRQFAPVPGDPINIRRRHEFYITAVCVENLGQYDCQQCVLNQFRIYVTVVCVVRAKGRREKYNL